MTGTLHGEFIDITRRIHPDMEVWPGDPRPQLQWASRLEDGDSCTVSCWTLGSHTGTHVDAPSHYFLGSGTVDEVPLSSLIGPCRVLEVADEDRLVTATALRDAHDWTATRPERVLLRTRNSSSPVTRTVSSAFREDFVALDESAAALLVEHGVRSVGIDGLSIERYVNEAAERDYTYPVHKRLLGAGVTVIEGLDLSKVTPGHYRLICLPLPAVGTEAAPARAVLEVATEEAAIEGAIL